MPSLFAYMPNTRSYRWLHFWCLNRGIFIAYKPLAAIHQQTVDVSICIYISSEAINEIRHIVITLLLLCINLVTFTITTSLRILVEKGIAPYKS